MDNLSLWLGGLILLAIVLGGLYAARGRRAEKRKDKTFHSGKGRPGVGEADPAPVVTPANLGLPISPTAETVREANEDSLLGEKDQGEQARR